MQYYFLAHLPLVELSPKSEFSFVVRQSVSAPWKLFLNALLKPLVAVALQAIVSGQVNHV